MWANNPGSDEGNSTRDLRLFRRDDQARAAHKWEWIRGANAEDPRSEEEIESGLLAALGLAQ